jgi:DNA polymerase-1
MASRCVAIWKRGFWTGNRPMGLARRLNRSVRLVRASGSCLQERAVELGNSFMSRLLIIDGHAYAYRAFYAIRELRSPTGCPTNAIFGFVKMLAKMRATLSPTHLVVVWDGGLSAERTAVLPGYKSQRPEMPADLSAQIDEIIRYLDAAGVPSLCREGVEADDYIACLARRAPSAGMDVVIASSDKDFMQLVSPKIGLLNPNDKTEAVWTAEQVRNKAGVEPSQIVDWLALVGDTVDNIPGVPGVGAKTAAGLLKQFGSIDALYQRLDEVRPDRLRTALRDSAGLVRRNQELVRLRDDVPCEDASTQLEVRTPDADRLLELFGSWGFKGMAEELRANRGKQADLFAAVSPMQKTVN